MSELEEMLETAYVEFSNKEKLAEKIWEYYIETMKTDKLLENDMTWDWSSLQYNVKRNFIEAIEINVCMPLNKVLGKAINLEFNEDIDFSSAERDGTCYMCGLKRVVTGIVPACMPCTKLSGGFRPKGI